MTSSSDTWCGIDANLAYTELLVLLIDAAVREPEAAMVRVVVALVRHGLHRPAARQGAAVRRQVFNTNVCSCRKRG